MIYISPISRKIQDLYYFCYGRHWTGSKILFFFGEIFIGSGKLNQAEIYPKTENFLEAANNNISFINEDEWDWLIAIG